MSSWLGAQLSTEITLPYLIFTFATRGVLTGFGAHPPSYRMRIGGFYTEVKQTRREALHSSPSKADTKNARSYNSILPYVSMAWCFVKHRHKFTFLPLPLCYSLCFRQHSFLSKI